MASTGTLSKKPWVQGIQDHDLFFNSQWFASRFVSKFQLFGHGSISRSQHLSLTTKFRESFNSRWAQVDSYNFLHSLDLGDSYWIQKNLHQWRGRIQEQNYLYKKICPSVIFKSRWLQQAALLGVSMIGRAVRSRKPHNTSETAKNVPTEKQLWR